MSAIERLTITLPTDMAGMVKGAVAEGSYASTSEVIREALRDWKIKQEIQRHRLAELKAEIDIGMADIESGRVSKFDAKKIIALGKKLRADRLQAASAKNSPATRRKTA